MVRRRLEGICAAGSLKLAELDIQVITEPTLRLDLEAVRCSLEETVAKLKPRLLVLDPFVLLHRIDENASGEVAPALARYSPWEADRRRRETSLAAAAVRFTNGMKTSIRVPFSRPFETLRRPPNLRTRSLMPRKPNPTRQSRERPTPSSEIRINASRWAPVFIMM